MRRRLTILIGCAALSVACADEGASKVSPDGVVNNAEPNNSSGEGRDDDFVPEVEEEFEFAEPAVLDANVFVPNETLNSVAVIDSRTLGIRTVPVGFNPTRIVGPSGAAPGAGIYVLNEGSSTVSVIDPDGLTTKNVDVLRRANAIAASPDGTWALAWFDAEASELEEAGDLSAATLVTSSGEGHQLALGFRLERVEFTPDSSSAMALSDDGVSVVRVGDIDDDALVPPVAVLPPDLQEFDRSDREVTLDPNGGWAIARIQSFQGVILTSLEDGVQWRVPLPSTPTDLDWVSGETPRVLGMLPQIDYAFTATVPDGLIAAANAFAGPAGGDMGVGTPDAGSADMGMADVGMADVAMPDTGGLDLGPADMGVADAATSDADPKEKEPDLPTMPAEGFEFVALTQPGLGAAEVAPSATHALVFSTLDDEQRAVLLDLLTLEQRGLAFEKGVRGAIADEDGKTFVVLHTKQEGAIPADASPSDPEYIARSWGISIVDVSTAATRLVLTERKPGETTLFSAEGTTDRLFMIFETPADPRLELTPSMRDVLRVDLESFATDSFRVSSLPEGLGRIDAAGKIYVNQIHPQGRITFVDVATDRRQTVTGYQLNSGID